MPDGLALALATPGLHWLLATAFAAGAIYGFAGFGAALLFMPIGARVTDPVTAVAMFAVAALGSALTVLPQAWAACDRRASLTVTAAALAVLPLGVAVLRAGDPEAIRLAVSAVVIATLAALMAGWRYRFTPGPAAWLGVGGAVGFLGGATGLNGPPLVLFQLGGQDGAARSRANTIVPLTLSSFAVLPVLALQGALAAPAIWLGLLILPLYALGGFIGRRLFDPARARLYRWSAYAIIAVAAVAGLPWLD
ncbi:MAG: sulfite exporter TauE/SafE family protein [Paracoccaceae bacterium]|nr:sulfite exporter TauE/SafE family protein [Paracoccaceae bacterium]